jgi:hypothetical protein
MRRCVATLVLVGLVAAASAGRHALAQDPVDNTRRSMGNLRPTPPATPRPNRTIVVVPHPYYGRYGHPYYRPYYPGGYGHYPYYHPPYPYYHGPVVYPPIYVPPETMYGPRAMNRFMGWGW